MIIHADPSGSWYSRHVIDQDKIYGGCRMIRNSSVFLMDKGILAIASATWFYSIWWIMMDYLIPNILLHSSKMFIYPCALPPVTITSQIEHRSFSLKSLIIIIIICLLPLSHIPMSHLALSI